jgi:hypothetical protein
MSKPLDATLCGSGNCGWYSPSVNGAAVPPARYGHAAGVLADNLYVFGGIDASGNFFTDLWVFNIEDRVWVQAKSAYARRALGKREGGGGRGRERGTSH